MWMVMDALTVFLAAMVATLYKFHTTPVEGARNFFHGTLFRGLSIWILLALLCGFTCALIVTSRRLHLYTPMHMTNFLHEQRMSAQACLTSGLLLLGALYLVRAIVIPRGIVLATIGPSPSGWPSAASSIAFFFIAGSIAGSTPATCSSSAPALRHRRSASTLRKSATWATHSRALLSSLVARLTSR